MTETVDLDFLAQLSRELLAEVKGMRTELSDVRTLTLQTSDYTRRLDRRIGELRDDFELMLKSELMGRFAHFETRVERQLDSLADRVGVLETR